MRPIILNIKSGIINTTSADHQSIKPFSYWWQLPFQPWHKGRMRKTTAPEYYTNLALKQGLLHIGFRHSLSGQVVQITIFESELNALCNIGWLVRYWIYSQIWNGIFVETQIAPNLTLKTHTNFQKDYPKQEEGLGCNDLSPLKNHIPLRIFLEILQISPQNILCGKSLCCTGLPNTLSTAVIWSTATAASRSHSPFLRRSFPKYFTGHWKSMLCILFPHRDIFSSSIEMEQCQIYSYFFGHQWPIHWYVVIAL